MKHRTHSIGKPAQMNLVLMFEMVQWFYDANRWLPFPSTDMLKETGIPSNNSKHPGTDMITNRVYFQQRV